MRIAVVGTGYVGLVAGACFAENGNNVVCLDVDERKIDGLLQGKVPFYEPGLDELVRSNAAQGRLRFSTDIPAGVREAAIIFIAVGTPAGEDGSADLQHVRDVAEVIAANMNVFKVIVLKSTVPVGTGDIVKEIVGRNDQNRFAVVSNPEFLKEGNAVSDFLKPDRVIIGTESEEAQRLMVELYAPYVRTQNPVICTDLRSAEMIKYAANALLATKISFINEIANLCEAVGADVNEVRKGIGADPRIGYQFLFPGVGYGGSCFPKDVKALIRTARSYEQPLDILQAVDQVNERQRVRFLERVRGFFEGDLRDRRVAVWGLSFKPKTDDMREAPSVTIIEGLLSDGANVAVYDPVAMPVARDVFGDRVTFCSNIYDAAEGAEAILVVTEWNQFRLPDFDRLQSQMKRAVIFDGRNLYNPQRLRERGFTYFGVGRS